MPPLPRLLLAVWACLAAPCLAGAADGPACMPGSFPGMTRQEVARAHEAAPLSDKPDSIIYASSFGGVPTIRVYRFTDGRVGEIMELVRDPLDPVENERLFYKFRQLMAQACGPPEGGGYWDDSPVIDPKGHWLEALRPGFFAMTSRWEKPEATIEVFMRGKRDDLYVGISWQARAREKPGGDNSN